MQGYPVIQASASSAHTDYSSYLNMNPHPVTYTPQNITASYTAQTVPIQNIPIQNVPIQNIPIQNVQVTPEPPIVEPKKSAPPKFKVRARFAASDAHVHAPAQTLREKPTFASMLEQEGVLRLGRWATPWRRCGRRTASGTRAKCRTTSARTSSSCNGPTIPSAPTAWSPPLRSGPLSSLNELYPAAGGASLPDRPSPCDGRGWGIAADFAPKRAVPAVPAVPARSPAPRRASDGGRGRRVTAGAGGGAAGSRRGRRACR